MIFPFQSFYPTNFLCVAYVWTTFNQVSVVLGWCRDFPVIPSLTCSVFVAFRASNLQGFTTADTAALFHAWQYLAVLNSLNTVQDLLDLSSTQAIQQFVLLHFWRLTTKPWSISLFEQLKFSTCRRDHTGAHLMPSKSFNCFHGYVKSYRN